MVMKMLEHNYKNAEDITASRIYNPQSTSKKSRTIVIKTVWKHYRGKKDKTASTSSCGVDDVKQQKISFEENRQCNEEEAQKKKNRKCMKVKVIQSSVVLSF